MTNCELIRQGVKKMELTSNEMGLLKVAAFPALTEAIPGNATDLFITVYQKINETTRKDYYRGEFEKRLNAVLEIEAA